MAWTHQPHDIIFGNHLFLDWIQTIEKPAGDMK